MFTENERNEIHDLFGQYPESLTPDSFKQALRDLRARFHPDNFEKYGDETVRQLATERFQRIERLAARLEAWLQGERLEETPSTRPSNTDPLNDLRARFAFREMKIEVRTGDKDLKYRLFGTFYRWLQLGDKFKVPDTPNAFIVADEGHLGRSIGFTESIRFYLTFGEEDSLETIVRWLYERIQGSAEALIIEGDLVPVEYDRILLAVKQRSFRRLEG